MVFIRLSGIVALLTFFAFEQPVPIISAPGTREFVVYNPRGQHVMLSHASWNLTRSWATLSERQGWYSVHDAVQAGWKCFRFD